MSFLAEITPIVITWNEEANIRRVFDRLTWAREVIVVDSGSTDGSPELLALYPNVRLFTRPFVSHADQVNFALRETHLSTEWVLSLDADYVLSEAILSEIAALSPHREASGYAARFVYYSLGRPLRGSLYPPRTVLFRADRGVYEQEGHAHRLRLDGRVVPLSGTIFHDDRKPIGRWLANQEFYATQEARRLHDLRAADLDWKDRIRRLGFVAPAAVAAYCLLVKGCILDGRPGWNYTMQRAVAEALLAMHLWEQREPTSRASS